jgi:hypothetical protein
MFFAKQHLKEAAAGAREFTLDAYRETGLNQAGQRTQTHFTYLGFVLGTIGKGVLEKAFLNSVKAIEGRNGAAKAERAA